jgi:dTMP kinase
MFIVLEGLDGAGTTTQLSRLAERLTARGHTVHTTREPSDGPVGRWIRRTLMHDPEAPAPSTLPWMYAADRADHLAREVEPALERGEVVLSDRYFHSSLAYQSLQRPLDEVAALNASFRVPDLTVFVEVPVDVSLARIEARGEARELFEERGKLIAIRDAYHVVIARLQERGDRIVTVDGSLSMDGVEKAIAAAVDVEWPSLFA